MRLARYDFVEAAGIDALRDDAGAVATYTAHERFANPNGLPLNPYGLGPFVRLELHAQLPPVPGTYRVTRDGDVLYVGETRNLAGRWGRRNYAVIDPRNCYRGGQSTNCRINNLIGRELSAGNLLALRLYETDEPKVVERDVYRALRPPVEPPCALNCFGATVAATAVGTRTLATGLF
ncbi:hypothetical protein [Nocardioides fonticola]|uniref:hypothetical protein n=1 Tax=Nocardioides fonticola TaxID=450363 RepID=UPI0031CF43D1